MRSLRVTVARFLVLLAVVLYSSSCLGDIVDASDCGIHKEIVPLSYISAAQALTSPYLEIGLEGNKRVFTYTLEFDDVCPDAHAKPGWHVTIDYTKVPPGWEISAGWATSAVTVADVPMVPHGDSQIRNYDGHADVGMKQTAVNGVSVIVLGLEFAFTSQGNLQADQAVVQKFLQTVQVDIDYWTPPGN